MRRGVALSRVCLLVFLGHAVTAAPMETPEAVRFFAPFFFPKVLQDLTWLDEYLRSTEFSTLRVRSGDPAAVDALFGRALELSWGNTGEALLLSALVTLDHRRVPVRIPLLGVEIPLPLTAEFPEVFEARVAALPTWLYGDSPPGAYGDRDKLQHFFGSAFLTLVSESEEAADAAGGLVERGESRWVAGETVDLRDVRANRQGQRFGRALLDGRQAAPSAFLRQEEGEP